MAKQQWFVDTGRKVSGPHSASAIQRAVREGRIRPTTRIRKGANGRWVEAGTVSGLSFDKVEVQFAEASPLQATEPVSTLGPRSSPEHSISPRRRTAPDSDCDTRHGWRQEARKELANVYGVDANQDEAQTTAACVETEQCQSTPAKPRGTANAATAGKWEPLRKQSCAGRCPITGVAELSDEVVIGEHCPFVQSQYSIIHVSARGAAIHSRNRGRFWKLYDVLMRFPYASIPFVGGNLQLFVIAYAWMCFPLCAAVDLLQLRNPLGRGNVRMGMKGLLVRRAV